MSRDVITVSSTMRISLLYRGEYSQWRERFMNYLEQTDGEAMIHSITHGEQPLHVVAHVIDRLARYILIQGLSNDIYSLSNSNDTAQDLWDALERQMRGFEYGEQDRKAAILYEYETFKDIEGERFLDTYLRYLQVINDLNKCGYKKDNSLVAEKTKVKKSRQKVIAKSKCEGSDDEDITNKKPEYVKSQEKKEDKKADGKKQDMSKVKCYNFKKEVILSKTARIQRKVRHMLKKPLLRQMRGFEYGEQDRKAAILYEYETFKDIEGEQFLDTYLRYLQVINYLNKCGYKKDNSNKKPEYVKSEEKKKDKKADGKKQDMNKVKCYNFKKEVILSKTARIQ
nr:hypothetical protein [Tanacetum cinerariifolium]